MATIKYVVLGKNNPAKITLRLSAGRGKIFRAKTGYVIDPDKWSTETNLPKKGGDAARKNLKTELEKLAVSIQTSLNEATANGIDISGDWLQQQIDDFQGKIETTEEDRLVNCLQDYVDYLPRKKQRDGKRGAAIATIKKYRSLKVKIENFETYRRKKILVKDVGLKFIDELEKYFLETDKLGENTTGRYIEFLKTVCLWAANENDIPAHPQLKRIKGYHEQAAKVFLNFEELEKIENTTYKREALENAKDWLIIGCFVGQRVSDLLTLTSDNLTVKNGLELVELVQKKTRKRVAIPLHPKIKTILEKRNGQFPYKISDVRFNEYVKDVCRLAGINQPTGGGKMITDLETGKTRKQYGTFPKYELISSHVCRRSYATNFYGEVPTSWLMAITAHSTEKQFLEYVGKSELDTAQLIADFYAKQILHAKKETILKIAK
jgi:integrase